MKRAAVLAAFAFVAGVAMPSATGAAWRIRKATEEANEYLHGHDRFIDGGVILYIVEKDPSGTEYLPGKPRLRVIGKERRGGIIDTRTHEIVAESENPTAWFNSREGAEIVLHGDHLPPKIIAKGGMGTGKTTDIAQWLWFQALDLMEQGIIGEFGATAPTGERSKFIYDGIVDMWLEEWWAWKERSQTFSLCTGHTIRLVSTHKSSKAEGSRIQGYNWIRHVGDELQDCYEENGNIELRGRDAPDGVFKRLNSVTCKDDPGWRTYEQKLYLPREDGSPSPWVERKKSILTAPFVNEKFIHDIRSSMSPNEFRRKALAEDLPSESRTYQAFDRKENVRPRPVMGAKDVTSRELARLNNPADCQLLIGHDPGDTANVSVILKAFQLPNVDPKQSFLDPPAWWVVGEVVTHGTTEHHCVELKKFLRRWNQRPLIYCDPHGVNRKNDRDTPDVTVLKTFIRMGLDSIRPAAYSPGKASPGQVPQRARIDMVNGLFCSALTDANGRFIRRLFLDADERGTVCAPELLDSIEIQENVNGQPETQRKGPGDPTHHTCALGYALWPIEKVRIADIRRGA